MNNIKKLSIILLSILINTLVSCKEQNKEEEKKKTKEIVSLKKEKPKAKPYLFKAKVNSTSGLVLRKDKTVESEKVILIPSKSIVNIIKITDSFEALSISKDKMAYGKWVEIEYQKPNEEYISGFVFDDLLDYQFNRENTNLIEKDTVTVYDEVQFINALSSNKVIWIDADEINLETYFNSEYEPEGVSYNEDYTDQYTFEYASLILSNYNNLEIRGKNKMVNIIVEDSEATVLTFNSCSNVFIDNINFFHKVFTHSCSGEVVQYEHCNNFRFQNVHFDGTGTIGSKINNSTNFNFLNCEFYRNSQNALFIENSTEIVFNRCDIHSNTCTDLFYTETDRSFEYQSIELENCFIKDNNSDSVFYNENDAGEGGGASYLSIKKSSIESNNLNENIFNLIKSEDYKLVITNSEIKNNTSLLNKFIIRKSHDRLLDISLLHTNILNNREFYGFSNKTENDIKTENITEKNVYNIASDTSYTKYNTYKKDGQLMFQRNENNINYSKETRQLSLKNHVLEGFHRIVFSNINVDDNFYGFPLDLRRHKNYFRHPFVGEGNIINGKLEGLWVIKPEFFNEDSDDVKYHLTYLDGILQESIRY